MPFRIVEHLRPIRNHPWLGYAAGVAIFATAFFVRYFAGAALGEVPFITLFPAILVAALVGGLQVGISVAVFSFVAGWYFFLPPYDTWTIESGNTLVALAFFWVTAAIQLYVIHSLNRAVDNLATERDRVGVLFRELQHRVANNLMFIVSLLHLQRRTVEANPEHATGLIDQARSRLEAMARIHRRLYDPETTKLSLATYLELLVKDILEVAGGKNVVCVVEVGKVQFELPRLITLSLLINELITNSLKHGFSGEDGGMIVVKLDRERTGYVLTVRDNGKGMPDAAATSDSLGMKIIRALVGQLGGEMTWSDGPGATARISLSP